MPIDLMERLTSQDIRNALAEDLIKLSLDELPEEKVNETIIDAGKILKYMGRGEDERNKRVGCILNVKELIVRNKIHIMSNVQSFSDFF